MGTYGSVVGWSGTSILLVEQNARMALEVSDQGYVFEVGKIALHGKQKELIRDSENPEIIPW